MKHSKKYIIISFILLIIFMIARTEFHSNIGELNISSGADLKKEIWYPMIAKTINNQELKLTIDNKSYSSKELPMYMNDGLQLMFPVEELSNALNCSVHLYKEETLSVEKREDEVIFKRDIEAAVKNDEEIIKTSPMTERDGIYYIPIETLFECLNYKYQWSAEKNELAAANQDESQNILPIKYDLREKSRVSNIKNQGDFGTCWAFAALSAMESALLPGERHEFSPDHMTIKNSFFLEQADGGKYTMGMAYLTAWQGPVYEKDDVYGDNQSPDGLEPVKHVQEIQVIEEKDFKKIKEAVFKYGGVQTSIFSGMQNASGVTKFYNEKNGAYYYTGTRKPNHDVTIIGWDDSYSKDNFKTKPEGDGAFICQNSWGTEFGDSGFIYVSYYDAAIGIYNVVYTSIEESDNYDNIYQTDLCGWVGQIGYNNEQMYGANIYQAESDEVLKAAGIYATGKDTSYKLYVVNDYKDTSSLKNKVLAAEGKLENTGFYTIRFLEDFPVKKGESYAIVLYIQTPGSVHPMAVEFQADEFTSSVVLDDGEGYISSKGIYWENVEETNNSNLCIKVYSKKN